MITHLDPDSGYKVFDRLKAGHGKCVHDLMYVLY